MTHTDFENYINAFCDRMPNGKLRANYMTCHIMTAIISILKEETERTYQTNLARATKYKSERYYAIAQYYSHAVRYLDHMLFRIRNGFSYEELLRTAVLASHILNSDKNYGPDTGKDTIPSGSSGDSCETSGTGDNGENACTL